MILGDATQPFASPEEALQHYGIKGMRWGHRKSEDSGGSRPTAKKESGSSGSSAQKEEAKKVQGLVTEMVVGQPVIRRTNVNTVTGSQKDAKETKDKDRGIHLSKEQKIALGIGAASVVGYVAYRHYASGKIDPKSVPGWMTKNADGTPLISDNLKKGLGHGDPHMMLKDPNFLKVDLSKGYADIRPKDGFKDADVAQRHAELVKTLDEFRAKYPSVRNMDIELAPMSHVPGMEQMLAAGNPAAVIHLKKGQARLVYHDTLPALDEASKAMMLQMQPGQVTHKDFLGNHEMGHMLAAAGNIIPPSWNVTKQAQTMLDEPTPGKMAKTIKDGLRYKVTMGRKHKQIMKKHGFSFKELSELSPYGATQPAEAFAELAGYYHSPVPAGFKDKLTPDQRRRAKALFDDLGGVAS